MLICPTVFLEMKRECTLVQGKCSNMVTSAMPPFHYSENKNSKNSINFFPFALHTETMWPYLWLLFRHIAWENLLIW